MQLELATESTSLRTSTRFRSAKKELLEAIQESTSKIRKVLPPHADPHSREEYLKLVQSFSKDRGRDLYFPFLASGIGSGPFVELMDGSVKFDMITGIGIHFFGHSHPALIEEMIDGIAGDVMQGNLEPGIEMKYLLEDLISKAEKSGSRLKHAWIMCSGTMVNEVALKIIRQKKTPATKILAFRDCFAGRSTAMQELTDNPGYRQGQPIYGEVEYLPFFDPKVGLEGSIDATLTVMREHLARYPERFAGLMIELIQGEGGFNFAPREFYVQIFEEAKKAGLAIWVDEIQSFGRTGELFAFQKFGLQNYIDVVTVGKMLQACAVLYTPEYIPKPGLVSGTFSGSTAALRTARRILNLLSDGGFLGAEGKIEQLSRYFSNRLEQMSRTTCKGMIQEIRTIGGMIAFSPFQGTMEDVKAVLMRAFDLGVVAFYCGHGPYLVRMLPPLGAMDEKEIDQVCDIFETALIEIAQRKK